MNYEMTCKMEEDSGIKKQNKNSKLAFSMKLMREVK